MWDTTSAANYSTYLAGGSLIKNNDSSFSHELDFSTLNFTVNNPNDVDTEDPNDTEEAINQSPQDLVFEAFSIDENLSE